MSCYKSCACRGCRNQSEGTPTRTFHKRKAHRTFRRETKRALRTGREVPEAVSTGYLS